MGAHIEQNLITIQYIFLGLADRVFLSAVGTTVTILTLSSDSKTLTSY